MRGLCLVLFPSPSTTTLQDLLLLGVGPRGIAFISIGLIRASSAGITLGGPQPATLIMTPNGVLVNLDGFLAPTRARLRRASGGHATARRRNAAGKGFALAFLVSDKLLDF